MRYLFAIIGFIVGVFLTLAVLAMFSTANESEMPNPFIPANIVGIIFAFIGYNKGKKKS